MQRVRWPAGEADEMVMQSGMVGQWLTDKPAAEKESMPRKKNLFERATSMESLFKAWKTVHASGSQSPSFEIRADIDAYSGNLFKNFNKLQRQLRRGSFSFSPVKGVLLQKGKGKRPIGIARVDDRILQRAMLETLMTVNALKFAINNPNSFGGNECGGVIKAISVLNEKIRAGAKYYIKTDIKNFFGTISHQKALNAVSQYLPDDSMHELLGNAIKCELENATAKHIQKYIDLFPKDRVGIVQGCCLSPMLGNMLLYAFDKEQNNRNTTCLRYIDDFIIVGGLAAHVFKSFDIALQRLSDLKLNAYTLDEPNTKAEKGMLGKGVHFLGCYIQPGAIRPSNKSRDALLGSLREKFAKSILKMREKKDFNPKNDSYSSVLNFARLKVKGWADAYRFCTDKSYLMQTDIEISRMLDKYMADAHRLIQAQCSERDKSLLLGIQSVVPEV